MARNDSHDLACYCGNKHLVMATVIDDTGEAVPGEEIFACIPCGRVHHLIPPSDGPDGHSPARFETVVAHSSLAAWRAL